MSNAFRIMQLGKINKWGYARTFRDYTSLRGLRSFGKNTALFAPGEALRMMMCFGTKDALVSLAPASLRDSSGSGSGAGALGVVGRAALLASVVGPCVALVESTVSLATETATLLQANTKGAGGSLEEAVSLAMRPKYLGRCWAALLAKNVLSNSTTFFFMFAAEFAAADPK